MNRTENIDFCIRYLLKQNGIYADIPDTLTGKQQLLRALINVWEPQPLSDEFLMAQNAELQAQLSDKGVVSDHFQLSTFNFQLALWQGDITRLKVDAIVNAANSQGLGCWQPLHICIDNCIHSSAGLQLRQECHDILRGGIIDTGKAIITKGYNLPSKYVIHTVGPIVPDHNPTYEQRQQLAQCYSSCIDLAVANHCQSIAFCCISTGVFGYPNREAAEIAIKTTNYKLSTINYQLKVVFNVFKDIDYDIYRTLIGTN